MFTNFNIQYTLAELERAGVDVTKRAVLYALFGVATFHQYFAPQDKDGRLHLLMGKKEDL